MTPHNRLRDQLRNSLELLALARQHPEDLEPATRDLAEIVNVQAGRLLAMVKPEHKRRWAWGEFIFGAMFSAGCVWGEWQLWGWRSYWWDWIALAALGLLAFASIQTTFKALFGSPSLTA